MMLPIVIAVIICILIVVVVYAVSNRAEAITAYDGNSYDVFKSFEDHQEAADAIAKLNAANVAVMKYLKQKHLVDILTKKATGERLSFAEERTRNLLERYNPEALSENSPKSSGDTSFTINKGEHIYFCVRSKMKDKNPVHVYEILLFVSLHEISHVAANQYGHGDEFWDTFKWMLQEAEKAGIYTPRDYKREPVMYCGMEIEFNPYYDW